ALGRVFQNAGVEPGSRIIWCGQNSTWVVATGMAARKIGAVAVPLSYRLTAEEAAYVIDDSDAVLIFADTAYAQLFADIRGDIPQVRDVIIFDGPAAPGQRKLEPLLKSVSSDELTVEVQAGAAGTMIYTSGTTGRPKGAVRNNSGDPSQVTALIEMMGLRSEDVYLTTGPLYHSGPSGFMAFAFAFGNTVILQRKFDAEDWLRLIDKYRVSFTFSAPTPVRLATQLPAQSLSRYDLSSVRVTIANAAPWSFALKKAYLEHFPGDSLFEVYGSTELGVNTIMLPQDQLRKPGSCGQPAPRVEIILIDDDGNEVTEPHVPGEVFIRSPSVFTTYHKAREKYLEDRRGDMQTVGDIAYFDEEGFYYICDRKKDMIISGGMNIYPAEIEAALEHHPEILDVAVFGIPSEDWGESVHAVVVKREGVNLSDTDIQAFAREHLAGYKVPRSIEYRGEIPRNGTGKILKRELRAPWWEGHASSVA
ncbi:MAG: AMP-binding protein, partial [Gammaproteobacteria bacterium]|nr:AMP-binding protein [Gammaproteobacteria bacterium]